jgi:hypothetical protein
VLGCGGQGGAGRGAAPAPVRPGLDPGAGGGAGPGLGRHVVLDQDREAAAFPALLGTDPGSARYQRAAARGGLAPAAAGDLRRAGGQPWRLPGSSTFSRAGRACQATGRSISDVWLALRRLAEQLETAGIQVLDNGSHVQLAPDRRYHNAVPHLVQPEQQPRLTQEQAEVLAVVIADGMATRRWIEEVRGATQLSIGADGPFSLPRDSSETLALLLS